MKFSLNLAQKYSDLDFKSLGTDEIVSRMGLQLGAIESVEVIAEKYARIVVAEVVTCVKHPDADKLSLCTIDDGGITLDVNRDDNGHVQVVCGANNVRAGIFVAWIPPGATVPNTYNKEPFVLEARELRGKVSNGMLASLKELDMGEDHDGILEINAQDIDESLLKPGTPFSKLYDLDDVMIDCENKMFTHRPDCFGNVGIAREVAGIFDIQYVSPEWYSNPVDLSQQSTADSQKLELQISNELPDLVPRFSVITMDSISVGPSPMWLKGYLRRIDIKPINNVVDITNYMMHLTGQPLHAYDYDKLVKYSDNPSLHPRMAHPGEKLLLLNGKTIELNEKDMVIATDKQAVGLAGVMGGAETEVDVDTKNILLECATFDMYAIRRTSMRHGLFTDAVTRFNKGQSPLQNDKVLARTMHYLKEIASAKQASELYDVTNLDTSADNLSHVEVTSEFINSRLGTNISVDDMKKLLENVEFKVEKSQPQPSTSILKVTVPFWRMDIAIKEDIVEEIGRLHGYQNIEAILPARTSKPANKNSSRVFKQSLRDKLVKYGANEVLTYSFVHGDLLKNTGTNPDQWAYHVRNAISPDLQYYRTSLTPSLLVKVRSNIKAQSGSDQNVFALFEIGKAHVKGHMQDAPESELPRQMRRIACVIAADAKTAKRHSYSAYFQAKKYVDEITNGQASYSAVESIEYPVTSVYEKGRSAIIRMGNDDQIIGVVGEYNQKARKSLKLPDYCAGFEIDTDLLQENLWAKSYKKLSQYPTTTQDVTYEVPTGMEWSTLNGYIKGGLLVVEKERGYMTAVEPLAIFEPDGSDKKRLSFRITASHPDKTLKTIELSNIIDEITETIHEKFQATRI